MAVRVLYVAGSFTEESYRLTKIIKSTIAQIEIMVIFMVRFPCFGIRFYENMYLM